MKALETAKDMPFLQVCSISLKLRWYEKRDYMIVFLFANRGQKRRIAR